MTRTERKLRHQLRLNRNKEICLVKLFARVLSVGTINQREEDFLVVFDEYLKNT